MTDAPTKKPSWHTGRIRPASQIEFVTEPPRSRRDPFYGIMTALAQHKDKWAIIATNYKSSDAIRLRQEYPDFEIITRCDNPEAKQSDPEWTVYAAYRGTEWAKDQLARERERRARKNRNGNVGPGLPAAVPQNGG